MSFKEIMDAIQLRLHILIHRLTSRFSLAKYKTTYRLKDLIHYTTEVDIKTHEELKVDKRGVMDYPPSGYDLYRHDNEHNAHHGVHVSALLTDPITRILALDRVILTDKLNDNRDLTLKLLTLSNMRPGDKYYKIELPITTALPNGVYELTGVIKFQILEATLGIGINSFNISTETIVNYDTADNSWEERRMVTVPREFKLQFKVSDVYDGEKSWSDTLRLVITMYRIVNDPDIPGLLKENYNCRIYIENIKFTKI